MIRLPGIYLITDRQQLPEGKLIPVIQQLLDDGLSLLQLREKDLSAAKLFPLALQLRKLTQPYNCKLLINDRVDLALAVEADGVHLGGHSLPVDKVRSLLGPDKLIGVSTHRATEIPLAASAGANFVTFGPVFHTPSKAAFGTPLGLAALRCACAQSPIPVFALGGINLQNIAETQACKPHGIAMISTLLAAESPTLAWRALPECLR